jgi:hypothetical protein
MRRLTIISSRIVLFAVISVFLLAGCRQSAEKASEPIEVIQEHTHEGNESIKLNQGEKWKVDEPMMVHIRNMESAVKALGNPDLLECQKLSAELQQHLELLTSNCTMKGQAHDELHKWLLPFLDLTNSFEKASSEEDALAYFNDIKESFNQFNIYFH